MYHNKFVRRAVAEVAGLRVEQVFLSPPVSDAAGFTLALPDGLDWADYEEQEEGPPIRTPRPVWDWYRQQYPQLGPEPPTPEAVAAWAPPTPEPPSSNLTDVEKMAQVFSMSEQQSASFLTQLKSRVWNYLADTDREGHLSPMEATAAGVNFCDSRSEYGIGLEYSDFITKGGHPLAAQALWDRIQAVKAKYEWFDSGVNAIFAEALGQI